MVMCAVCRAESTQVPLTWTMVAEGDGKRRRTMYYCDACSRENLRSIEAGLDPQYW
jgi:hypothetical protein